MTMASSAVKPEIGRNEKQANVKTRRMAVMNRMLPPVLLPHPASWPDSDFCYVPANRVAGRREHK